MADEEVPNEQQETVGTTLTPQQARLLAALVCNPDMQAAADSVGVGRTTAYRWLNQPGFREEIRRRRNEAFAEAMATVTTRAKCAVDGLLGLLDVGDPRLRRLVCNDILGHAIRIHDLEDVERRLTALEEAAKKRGGGRA